MLEFVFGMLTNSALLLFGVFASAAILGIPFNKKNAAVLLAFCIFVNLLQFLSHLNTYQKGNPLCHTSTNRKAKSAPGKSKSP